MSRISAGYLEKAELPRPGTGTWCCKSFHGPYRSPQEEINRISLLTCPAALKCQFPPSALSLGNHELSQWTAEPLAKGDVDFNAIFREGVARPTAPKLQRSGLYQAYSRSSKHPRGDSEDQRRLKLSDCRHRFEIAGDQLAGVEATLATAADLTFRWAARCHRLGAGRDP